MAEKMDAPILQDHKDEAKTLLVQFNEALAEKKYFLGDEVSLVDCFAVSVLTFFFPKFVSQTAAKDKFNNLVNQITTFYGDVIVSEDLFGKQEYAEADVI